MLEGLVIEQIHERMERKSALVFSDKKILMIRFYVVPLMVNSKLKMPAICGKRFNKLPTPLLQEAIFCKSYHAMSHDMN